MKGHEGVGEGLRGIGQEVGREGFPPGTPVCNKRRRLVAGNRFKVEHGRNFDSHRCTGCTGFFFLETNAGAWWLETGSKSSPSRGFIDIDGQEAQEFFWRRRPCSPGNPHTIIAGVGLLCSDLPSCLSGASMLNGWSFAMGPHDRVGAGRPGDWRVFAG